MSFHFNLSSDEEDDGFDEEKEEFKLVVSNQETPPTEHAPIVSPETSTFEVIPFKSNEAEEHGDWGKFEEGDEEVEEEEEDNDDEDSVDWEDGQDEQDGDVSELTYKQQEQLAKLLSNGGDQKELIFDFGDKGQLKNNDIPSSTPKKRKRSKRLRQLTVSQETEALLLNLHRSHRLCLTSNLIQTLGQIPLFVENDFKWSLLAHLIYSLIPFELILAQIPTIQQLQSVSRWYFDLVNKYALRIRNQRRVNVAMGAPTTSRRSPRKKSSSTAIQKKSLQNDKDSKTPTIVSSPTSESTTCPIYTRFRRILHTLTMSVNPDYLPNDETLEYLDDPSMIMTLTPLDKTLLWIFMCRHCLHWNRVRIVTALKPIPLYLTMDHPLLEESNFYVDLTTTPKQPELSLTQWRSFFQIVYHSCSKLLALDDSKPPAKRESKIQDTKSEALIEHEPNKPPINSLYVWTEIQCLWIDGDNKKKASTKPKHKWIHLDVAHELFNQSTMVETLLPQIRMNGGARDHNSEVSSPRSTASGRGNRGRWLPSMSESGKKVVKGVSGPKETVSYVIAVEYSSSHSGHDGYLNGIRLTDVTPRYANQWSETLLKRGQTKKERTSRGDGQCIDKWWNQSLQCVNERNRPSRNVINIDVSSDSDNEQEELEASMANETIPTNKVAFKNHPTYALKSLLNQHEVLTPEANKHVCGIFKGEPVYRRGPSVSPAYVAQKWLYLGRKVREMELPRPAKLIKARRSTSRGFKALKSYGGCDNSIKKQEDVMMQDLDTDLATAGKQRLYGHWQTDPWQPPYVGPNDAIPVNEHRNIEKALLNPGLVHLEQPRISVVAKKLSIPYAPCLLGFEGHGGNRTPTIRGIVVHEHNAELLREAFTEYASSALEQEFEQRHASIYLKWKRLIVGILTKARLEEEYG